MLSLQVGGMVSSKNASRAFALKGLELPTPSFSRLYLHQIL
ncbi:hypothetical protein J3A73_004524 [Rhizobium sp. PvP099]|nr:hypothetical protein [Rhizobium sp. PvP099]